MSESFLGSVDARAADTRRHGHGSHAMHSLINAFCDAFNEEGAMAAIVSSNPLPVPTGAPPLGSIMLLTKSTGRSRKDCKAALVASANDCDAARALLEAAAEVEATSEAGPSLQTVLEIEGLCERLVWLIPPETGLACVSHTLRAATSQETYWRTWVVAELEPTPCLSRAVMGHEEGIIIDWRGDDHGEWYCYWQPNMRKDPAVDYVFKPPLEVAAWSKLRLAISAGDICDARAMRLAGHAPKLAPSRRLALSKEPGIVRPMAWAPGTDGPPARALFEQMASLRALWKSHCAQHGGHAIGWGDESDGQWMPLLLPWSAAADGELTPVGLLRKLGAHPQLLDSVCARDVANDADDDPDEEDTPDVLFRRAIRAFLAAHPASATFQAGSEKLNPVPCFAVALVRPDLVAGFVGGVVHT